MSFKGIFLPHLMYPYTLHSICNPPLFCEDFCVINLLSLPPKFPRIEVMAGGRVSVRMKSPDIHHEIKMQRKNPTRVTNRKKNVVKNNIWSLISSYSAEAGVKLYRNGVVWKLRLITLNYWENFHEKRV